MTDETPPPGTIRYSCPLDCDWHYDVPPPSPASLLGVTADPAARNFEEAVNSLAHRAVMREAEQTDRAVREHLATHDSESEVAQIEQLLADAGQAGINWRP
jgi:hypothetical protein